MRNKNVEDVRRTTRALHADSTTIHRRESDQVTPQLDRASIHSTSAGKRLRDRRRCSVLSTEAGDVHTAERPHAAGGSGAGGLGDSLRFDHSAFSLSSSRERWSSDARECRWNRESRDRSRDRRVCSRRALIPFEDFGGRDFLGHHFVFVFVVAVVLVVLVVVVVVGTAAAVAVAAATTPLCVCQGRRRWHACHIAESE